MQEIKPLSVFFLWFSVFKKTAVDIDIGFYFLNTTISVRHTDPGLIYS
jgi:hypothetical protein